MQSKKKKSIYRFFSYLVVLHDIFFNVKTVYKERLRERENKTGNKWGQRTPPNATVTTLSD